MSDINDYQVWTAIISPMSKDGTIDYPSYERLLREQEKVGNAIVILGSTGESLNIDAFERKDILDFALGLGLSVPMMCGVGGSNTNEQREWIEYLNTLELDAYLVPVPMYAKPGAYGQYEWFKTLLDEANKPCMVYNVPGRTGKPIELKALEMLKGHENFWAIKEASGSVEEFTKIRDAGGARMMSGDDPMLPAFAAVGAKGVVSVASNVWPEATKEYARQCVDGSFTDNSIWQDATESLFLASNPIPTKAILNELGRIETPITRSPLSEKDMTGLDKVIDANRSIGEWLAEQSS